MKQQRFRIVIPMMRYRRLYLFSSQAYPFLFKRLIAQVPAGFFQGNPLFFGCFRRRDAFHGIRDIVPFCKFLCKTHVRKALFPADPMLDMYCRYCKIHLIPQPLQNQEQTDRIRSPGQRHADMISLLHHIKALHKSRNFFYHTASHQAETGLILY